MQYLKDKIFLIVPGLLSFGLLIFAYGCEPTTRSLVNPNTKVTSAELETEFKVLLLQHEARTADIGRQQEIRNLIFQTALATAESDGVNPLGVITSIMTILGIGALGDDLRLRKIIKTK